MSYLLTAHERMIYMMEAFRLDDIHKVVVRLHDKESWALWDKVWIMNAASRSDQDDAVEPVLFQKPDKTSVAEFKCPRCGCDVGEITMADMHIQGDDHYCADCGQRIDWQSASRKYEGRSL